MKSLQHKSRIFAASLTSLALASLLAGCGLGTMATSGTEPVAAVNLSGKVFGGEQGVSGSVIGLYAVGTTGYGSVATSLLTSTVTTDKFGSFGITGLYTCPSANSLVYITATGGNPGLADGTNNTAIKLAAALGRCGDLTPTTGVFINEVSTVATAFALSQYFTPTFGTASTDSFGAPNTTQAQVGIKNAFAMVKNLATQTDGNVTASFTYTSAYNAPTTPATITVTNEATKIYTIANILASCVNSDGGPSSTCQTTLFPDVTPTAGALATDTLQAAVYMNLYPTSNNANGTSTNLPALFALQAPTSPFVGLATAPADWTISVNYSAGTSATQTLINVPNGIAIDGNGNAWIINLNTAATSTESMTEFSTTGVPLANPLNSGATAPASLSGTSPRNLEIDVNNNVFVNTTTLAGVYEYIAASGTTTNFGISSSPYTGAFDGNGNLFIAHGSIAASPSNFGFEELLGGTLAATNQVRYTTDAASTTNQYAAVSTDGKLYLSRGTVASTGVLAVTGINPGTCTTFPCTPTNDTSLTATYTAIPTGSNVYGLAAGSGGGMWAATNGVSTISYISGGVSTNLGSATSLLTPRYVAVDGNNVAWIANRGGNSTSALKNDGTILSPVNTTTPGTVGFKKDTVGSQTGMAVDPSGNVWISNGTTAGAQANSLTVMVGVAGPTVTPIAQALAGSTAANGHGVGQKP